MNVLQHKEIGDVVAVVIRYFGGVKLGAGGLVRAYGTATQQACELLTLIDQIPHQEITIECDYADEPALRRWIEANDGSLLSSVYTNIVVLVASIPSECIDDLQVMLAGWSNSQIIEKTNLY